MLRKVRPNALIIAIVCALLTGVFGWRLYGVIESVIESGIVNEGTVALILALAAGTFTPLGGLLTLAGQCATDPEPNPIIEYVRATEIK